MAGQALWLSGEPVAGEQRHHSRLPPVMAGGAAVDAWAGLMAMRSVFPAVLAAPADSNHGVHSETRSSTEKANIAFRAKRLNRQSGCQAAAPGSLRVFSVDSVVTMRWQTHPGPIAAGEVVVHRPAKSPERDTPQFGYRAACPVPGHRAGGVGHQCKEMAWAVRRLIDRHEQTV
jgi:hypothetical protein